MGTNFSLFLLCNKCPVSWVVCQNVLTAHYYICLKITTFRWSLYSECFDKCIISRWWDKVQCTNNALVFSICEKFLSKEFNQIWPYPQLKRLINVINHTFIRRKQFDKSNNFPGILFLICSHWSIKQITKIIKSIQNLTHINGNSFNNAVST